MVLIVFVFLRHWSCGFGVSERVCGSASMVMGMFRFLCFVVFLRQWSRVFSVADCVCVSASVVNGILSFCLCLCFCVSGHESF